MSIETVRPRSRRSVTRLLRTPRVALATDAPYTEPDAERIPAMLKSMVDPGLWGDLSPLRKEKTPPNADGLLVWLAGETLLAGSASEIRRDLHYAGRRAWVPVHRPGLPHMDLISIEPRWQTSGAQSRNWRTSARIQSAPTGSNLLLQALEDNRNPWAALTTALLEETQTPGRGLELLARLWQNAAVPPVIRSLVLRNLIIVLRMHKNEKKADELLALGQQAFPGYAELYFLQGLLSFQRGEMGRAAQCLKQAYSQAERGYIGGGGENSYRARWLLGVIIAEHMGDEKVASMEFVGGLTAHPVFEPAVDALLKLRFPADMVRAIEIDLCRVVRQEHYPLEPVFEFLLFHRRLGLARQLLDAVSISDEQRSALRERLEGAALPLRHFPVGAGGKPGIRLTGPFLVQSSLARINRQIGQALLQAPDLDVALDPYGFSAVKCDDPAADAVLSIGMRRRLRRLDLTIRHHWPPDFRKPAAGKLAAILPWEYGAVPRSWVSELEKNAEELWVPSAFVRDVFVRAGLSTEKIQVIPNGVDTRIFTPTGPARRPPTAREFVFLFVGGAIRRKGVDLLLEAYQEAFLPGEDVTLVIQESGSQTFYANQNLVEPIRSYAGDPNRPHVILLMGGNVSDADLAALYRGCDAFVMPYRGEGFGMPIAEAAACGKPVITTALGPAPEFLAPHAAYFVLANVAPIAEELKGFGELSGELTWFEPDRVALASLMRHVYENRREAAQRGAAASARVRAELAWPRITSLYAERVRHLCGLSQSRQAAELVLG